jgi:dephospho-CoA kinase
MLIGISGTDGGGKGTVVDYLVTKYQFTHYSSRSIILEYINAAGLPDTRAQMRLTANELRAKFGNDFLVTQALARMKRDGVERAIVESIRAVAEAECLKAHGGILLAVDADQTVRYARVQSRRSETDKVTFEEFVAHEELEKNDPNPHGMQKGKVIEMADYTIMNDGTIEALQEAVDAFLQNYI